ncbi:MAG TPA: VWA domain-containing protein [Blastocatellia bacterium]|nr:VWA domain-containing protein [Blastocatellia bacterium]
MSTKLIAIVLILAMQAVQALALQSTAARGQDQDTIKLGTATVQMDVIVTDKSGRRINGLKASDFEVLDEGKPQVLDFFTAIEGSRVTAADGRAADGGGEGAAARKVAGSNPLVTPFEGRFITLVMDDLHLSTENLLRARKVLADYINTQTSATDLMAVTATTGAVGSLQQFTTDKQRLISALNRISALGGFSDRARDSRFQMTSAEAVRIDAGDTAVLQAVKRRIVEDDPAMKTLSTVNATASRPGLGRSGTGRPPTLDPESQNPDTAPTNNENEQVNPVENLIRSAAKALVSQMGVAARQSLKTLSNLFTGMAGLPGRKVVVLVTESLVTGVGTTEDLSGEINNLIDAARRSGVSVYALDAAGLRANNTTASERLTGRDLQARSTRLETSFSDFENLGAARTLVLGTGGDLIANTNDLSAGLQKAVEDSSTYYVVGFTPAGAPDNKFHRLSVSVRGRPDLVVRTRRGYLSINAETARGTETELVAALVSPMQRNDIPLEVVANVLPKGGDQSVITGLTVGRNYLTLPAADAPDQVASYEVAAWVFAAGRDDVVGRMEQVMTFNLKDPAVKEKLKKEGLVYVRESTKLEPGFYQIRAVVREKSTGLVGSSYQFFEVPNVKNKKAVSLSSVLLTPAGQMEFRGRNGFKPGTEMDMRWVVYNPPKELATLTQKVKLLDAQGKVLMDSPLPSAPASGDTAPQGTRMKAPPTRGKYALVVSLSDAKGKLELERRADFIVE